MQNKNAADILGIATLKANSSHSHFFFLQKSIVFFIQYFSVFLNYIKMYVKLQIVSVIKW